MLFIQDVLISDEVVSENFLCNLDACKGACCWEGDFGAPLEAEELLLMDRVYEEVKPFMSPAGIAVVEKEGSFVNYKEDNSFGTPLVAGGPCAYMTLDETGKAQCAIERAYKAGATGFYKPISCHLYPVRVTVNEEANFEALNYDRWDICSAACTKGDREQVRIHEFVKPALLRKYGQEFYDELCAAAEQLE